MRHEVREIKRTENMRCEVREMEDRTMRRLNHRENGDVGRNGTKLKGTQKQK
jgi:hypothetical protein